ncbi:hypothetical protein [Sinomonas humi]|uniref:hypothetical protein n=1 Tax=Sinomonas humi TaxID=1338436 RepID=UPI0012E0C355|nr:hypothetical protein [Sinomonas humi]
MLPRRFLEEGGRSGRLRGGQRRAAGEAQFALAVIEAQDQLIGCRARPDHRGRDLQ